MIDLSRSSSWRCSEAPWWRRRMTEANVRSPPLAWGLRRLRHGLLWVHSGTI